MKKKYRRIYAIPDIHGRRDLALELMVKDGYSIDKDRVVFLADYIDRGPDSKGVLDLVKAMVVAGAADALCGNHENFALDSYVRHQGNGIWMSNGGYQTLKSYPTGQMSEEHIWFLGQRPFSLELQGFYFSHAPVPTDTSRHRHKCLYGPDMGAPGEEYTVWERTWYYVDNYSERADFPNHKGPRSLNGRGKKHLIGICGHIHRLPGNLEVRIYPKYRMLDCGAGCSEEGVLAVHECISSRTLYARPSDLKKEALHG